MSSTPSQSPLPTPSVNNNLEYFLNQHLRKLLIIIGSIVFFVLILVVVNVNKQSQENTAAQTFLSAQEATDYQKIIDQYPRTPAAGSSLILLAQLKAKDNNLSTAIQLSEQFLQKFPKHPARGNAQIGLIEWLIFSEKIDKAKIHLTKLSQFTTDPFLSAFALLRLGDLALKENQTKAAEAYWKKIQTDFPNTALIQESQERLFFLNSEVFNKYHH